MSNLAEYARQLRESDRRVSDRVLTPCRYESSADSINGVRAVIVDVYGTLVDYWRAGFETREGREALLLRAFAELIDRFEMADTIARMNPAAEPHETLRDFYNGLLALNHEKSVGKGVEFPEVRVEEVWAVILMMLKRNGYDAGIVTRKISHQNSITPEINCRTRTARRLHAGVRPPDGAGATINFRTNIISPPADDTAELARYLAYTYNFLSMGCRLYPNAYTALKRLKDANIALGIVADAQLYTPIDLTLLLRGQSNGAADDYNELFDPDLTLFSYEYGSAKPGEVLYRRLFDALYEYRILPSETVFVGNDLTTDIRPAAQNGMKTALFCGDGAALFGKDDGIVPDIAFEDWGDLPDMLSFHGS